ncbi:hypothetical protein ACFO1B_44090 [Dactylosporangium siamense]|uniref:Uncharacterized protein n=1 Tax=Dactylosporangium siamense TaxID=685454 RepID=A0A919UI03_9ACTN|nr:hypothetical protein [Dactylosporangium siamense]GIG52916.1 hypothetical protein Dsi01nite_109570 [Dactylosporangium siamense]
MSQPAQVTADADWRTVTEAIEETVLDIHDLREDFADALDRLRQEQDMTDPHYDDRRDEELQHAERRREEELDAQDDGRVDGDYDLDTE